MPEESARFAELLRLLSRHGVDFIVVGGVGAVLQGAPIVTADLDIVHARTPENIRGSFRRWQRFTAYYRTRTDRRFEPNEEPISTAATKWMRQIEVVR